MASAAVRRVLSAKSLQASSVQKPASRSGLGSYKRQRSPERDEPATSQSKSKRVRAAPATASQREPRKEKNGEREQQRNEFKEKYTKAFPNWSFYIDIENVSLRSTQVKQLVDRIEHLGGKHEDFFSRAITHLITDKPIPPSEDTKENHSHSRKSPYDLKSPFKLKSKFEGEPSRGNDIVSKAASYGMKIWNSTKLDSVLSRCLDLPSVSKDVATKSQPPPTRQLERLLANEKTHGPSDRDPSQKRHDYRYFTKGSFFVLVEDLFDKTATIAMHEYPPTKDQKGKVPWPVLHCDSRSRGPFIAFDDKEKARWEKLQKAKNKTEVVDRKEALIRQTRHDAEAHVKGMGDLRRSVSLNNLHKRWAKQDQEAEVPDSTNASGFLVSGTGPGYMAASGNSVGVTSTTGTTSTTSGMAQSHLPLNMDSLLKRQVVTSRRALPKGKPGNMEPPPVPSRPGHLKKSKSTNTLKLPKREEGSKPGYCESCRLKFDDFKTHVLSSKHRRFAQNDSNFATLDAVLDRLQRRSVAEAQQTEQLRQLGQME